MNEAITANDSLRIIVGLGNPGPNYDGTRHNIGFEVIDTLARLHQINVSQSLYRARAGRGIIAGKRVLLLKPQTFMNLSGESVALALQKEGVPLTHLLVISDDIHLPVGRVRMRGKGSAGGQNGLKSIAAQLGSQDWARLRIGVGEPPPGLQVEWVLSRYSKSDRQIMDDVLGLAVTACEMWTTEGVDRAGMRVNGVDMAAPPV